MHRRLRTRSVALIAWAAVALALPVAVAAPAAQAADPEIHAEWRGWVAHESSRRTFADVSEHVVKRSWSVDVDRARGGSAWEGSVYSLQETYIPDCGQYATESSGEGTGTVAFNPEAPYDTYETAGGQAHHGFPSGTPAIDWDLGNEGYVEVQDFVYNCGNPQWEDGLRPVEPPGWLAGAPGSYVDPPMTAANDHSWQVGDERLRSIVCMSRSTVDSDRDGLPDEVDLAPTEAGAAIALGHPAGSDAWSEDILSRYGGPDGKEGLPDCPAATQPQKKTIVSLGDSYASGEGAYAYQPATDLPGVNHCHRSTASYPFVAEAALNRAGHDISATVSLACSGAKIKDLLSEKFCGTGCDSGTKRVFERPQLEQLRDIAKTENVSVVTVGIGGNDAGFSRVVAGCVVGPNCVAKFDKSIEGGAPPEGAMSIEEIAAAVADLLPKIREVAANAEIVFVGYPLWIDTAYAGCPGFIGADEAEWMRGQIILMNRALNDVVTEIDGQLDGPAVRFLHLDDVYGSQVLCNDGPISSQWVHGIVERNSEADVVEGGCTLYDNKLPAWLIKNKDVCNESFHPKADGHAATGEALARCVSTGDCGTPTTETLRDPSELTPEPPTCSDGPLIQQRCATEPGREMRLRASGFTPGSKVSVDVHSRSVHLAEATVAADGTVDVTVTVPAGAVMPGEHRLVISGPGEQAIVRVAQTPLDVSCATGLTDIGPYHPVCADVVWLRSTGVTQGFPDGTYRPAGTVSRRQMASFLWRLSAQPPAPYDAPTFPDTQNDPAADAISWLSGVGITTGYPDGRFGPGDGLTRGQMATFLWRFAGEPPVPADAPTYSDVPPAHPHASGIRWMGSEKITLGKGDGTFGPGDTLIRQHMASFLRRFGEPRNLPE